uniref:Uncharacterized protein n=1 Tax=Glossina brevipalpis TaxID=37001 RepID=A0A1A9WKL2_9MUSC
MENSHDFLITLYYDDDKRFDLEIKSNSIDHHNAKVFVVLEHYKQKDWAEGTIELDERVTSVNSAPTLVFDSMKPFMLQAANKQFRGMVNRNITEIMGERLLSNSITPLNRVTAKNDRNDLCRLPDYNCIVSIYSRQLSNSSINGGISSFHRSTNG